MKTSLALGMFVTGLACVTANADPQSLEAAKASARRVAEATCPLARMVKDYAKMDPGSPGAQVAQVEIDKESKSLQYLKAEETEKIRSLQLTNKEGRELNEYIDGTLSKACAGPVQ